MNYFNRRFFIQPMQMIQSFLQDKISISNLIVVFLGFSSCSALKPNKTKNEVEVVGIGVLQGIRLHFLNIEKFRNWKKFQKCHRQNQRCSKTWRPRTLTFQGKVTVFDNLALFKIIHLALI